MFRKRLMLVSALILPIILAACGAEEAGKVCVVLDTGGENDRSFNEFTLKGARDAAEDAGVLVG